MGVAITWAPEGVGPQNPTIKLAYWVDHLGQLLSQNFQAYIVVAGICLLSCDSDTVFHQ